MKKKIIKIASWTVAVIISIMLITSAILLIYKDDIKSYAIQEMNKYLNKPVQIGYIDLELWKTFPNMSISLEDVFIQSQFGEQLTADTALFAKSIKLKFNPLDLINGDYNVRKIDLNDAYFNMTILEDGNINYDFIKSPENEDTNQGNFAFNLEQILITNTHYKYNNQATEQLYDFDVAEMEFSGNFNEEQYKLKAESNFDIRKIKNKSITLISNKKAKLSTTILMDNIEEVFEIEKAELEINEMPFLVKGKISEDSLNFEINSQQLNLQHFANQFTLQELDIINDFQGDGEVDIDVKIAGTLANTSSPEVIANFDIHNGTLTSGGIKIQNIIANGKYDNGVVSNEEKLLIKSIAFQTLGESFKGELLVRDFHQPRLSGKAKGNLHLEILNKIFKPKNIEHLSGDIELDGKFDVKFLNFNTGLNNLKIYNLDINTFVENFKFKNVGNPQLEISQAEIKANTHNISLKNVHLKSNESELLINGNVGNLLEHINSGQQLKLNLNLSSAYIDLDKLFETEQKTTTKNQRTWILPNKISGNINLEIDQLSYSSHQYKKIQGSMFIGEKNIHFPVLKGINASALVNGNLKIQETSPSILKLTTNLYTDDIELSTLFKEWNNFDQNIIKSENISGKTTAKLNFSGNFDLHEGFLDMQSIAANADIAVQKGVLTNVSTFKEIIASVKKSAARLVLSKKHLSALERELESIQFNSLQNQIVIKDGKLFIPKMSIATNVLDLDLIGEHSFDNIIDYSFSFRFRELKAANQNSEFGEIIDDGTGFKLFLRMYGDLDDPKFEWDKQMQKEDRAAKQAEAKDEFKQTLKDGFTRNNDSVNRKNDQKTKETVEIQFNQEQKNEEDDTPSKKSKWKEKLEKLKEKKEEENKPEFEFE